MELKNIDTIVVIMFGLLGDVLMRTPVLKALREIYPKSKIVVTCDRGIDVILENNIYLDEIIVFNRKKFLSKILGTIKVKYSKCDLIIDLYNGGSSSNIALLSGAKYKMGHKNQKHKSYYNILSEEIKDNHKDIYSYNEQLISRLRALSKQRFDLKPIFFIEDGVKADVKEYIKSFGIDIKKLYTLNLGSGGTEKIPDYDLYLKSVKYIYEKYNLIPAVVSNPSQEHLQKKFIDKYLEVSNLPYVKLKPLSLNHIGAFIEMSNFIITPDTGLLHIAIARNSYILALFTYTNPNLVDYGYKRLFCVYEYFDKGVLFQKQHLTLDKLIIQVDALFELVSH